MPAWRTRQGAGFLWEFVDDEFVVYNAGSGLTHLLDLLTGEVLLHVAEAAATEQDLVAFVAAYLDEPAGPEHERAARAALAELAAAELVEPLP